MTTRHDTTDHGGTDAQHRIPDGIVGLQVDDGDLVIYDRENHSSWIQSDETLSLTELR